MAVVVATFWGGYTFIFKEILLPSWAPASLVIEVKPRQEGPEGRPEAKGTGASRLRLRVIATNPSSRTLYLLPNVWWATALQRSQAVPSRSFETEANAVLRDPSVLQAERGQALVSAGVVATGRLFIDDQILPGETVSRDLSIALPTNNAPMVLQLMLPALTRKPLSDSGTPRLFAGQRLGWAYSENREEIYPVLCKGSDKNINCHEDTDDVIEKEIQRYDPRSVIFHRTLLIND
ncbi:MAG: hypothetical protein VKK97_03570 [Synechococcaceae cyanobacterium]|nr:hypothetical protein [Synechococcaceae cyanobacterium]